jgi:uncharacterized delta-60 repeat protein
MRPLRPARLALTLFLVAAFSAVALVAQAAPGDLDTTFSGDGMRTLSFGPGADSGREILALAGGKLLVAGQAQVGGTTRFGLARLRANGALDTTFGGGDGRVVGPAGAAWGLVVNSAGAIVVAGQADPGLVAVARYTAAGAVDTTFGGGDGLALTGFGAGTTSIAYDVILVGGGKILVTGEVWNGVDYDLLLARYLASGALDTTFGGGDGKVVVDFAGGDDGGFDLLLLPNGKFLVAGWAGVGGQTDPAVYRFTAAGALDTTFGGGDGVARVNFSNGSDGGGRWCGCPTGGWCSPGTPGSEATTTSSWRASPRRASWTPPSVVETARRSSTSPGTTSPATWP